MRVLYLGHHDIGVRCLNELVTCGENVVAVFALPSGYWEKVSRISREAQWYASVEATARQHGLSVYTPEDINTADYVSRIRQLKPDVLFSISWDQMLKRSILDLPPRGCFNLHFGLLPENRGHAPINWAIIHGYTRTGVTMHRMVEAADQGDIVGQCAVEIGLHDTARDVYLRLLDTGTALFRQVLRAVQEGRVTATPQPSGLATYGKRRRPEGGQINWTQTAFDIYNLTRALTHPYPGAFTTFRGQRLFVWQTRLYENTSQRGTPGEVIEGLPGGAMRVAAGRGSLALYRVQVEGEAEISGEEFKASHRVTGGERLGEPTSLPSLLQR